MSTNQDMFKEAIAEAKTIRELALANAKESVSQSITPHLKDLLAAKLQEMEGDDEDMHEEDVYDENVYEEEEEEEAVADEDEPAEDDAEESEDDAEDHEGELDVEDMSVEDLRNLIRDLISQEMPGADMEMDMEPEMDTEEIPTDDMVGPEDGMGDDEEINLEELMAELEGLTSEDKEEVVDEADHDHEDKVSEKAHSKKHKEMEEDLTEAVKTITILKEQLAEVNLLNSKLLYLNKIMKAHNLTEDQKARIITTFDKAETVKEAKLIYHTLSENLSSPRTKTAIKEHKSFASKAIGQSTKPITEVITEVDEKFKRMQKLAGII